MGMKFCKIQPKLVAVFVLLLFALMPGGNAMAQNADEPPRFRIGALDIHPGFEVSVKTDDNIFLSKNDAKNDTIMTYAPSIDVELPFAGESSFEAGFDYTIEDFNKFGNEDNESKTATIGLNLERINGNIYSRTSGTWEDTSDASSSEQESATGARTQRTKGEVDTALGFGG